jgi:hypothetical protein
MLYAFNAACFSSYTRSCRQADKTPNKNYYVHGIMLFYTIHVCVYIYI